MAKLQDPQIEFLSASTHTDHTCPLINTINTPQSSDLTNSSSTGLWWSQELGQHLSGHRFPFRTFHLTFVWEVYRHLCKITDSTSQSTKRPQFKHSKLSLKFSSFRTERACAHMDCVHTQTHTYIIPELKSQLAMCKIRKPLCDFTLSAPVAPESEILPGIPTYTLHRTTLIKVLLHIKKKM